MYYERLVDSVIERKLRSSGAVLVAGPKFCGKTTTCMRFQKSFVKLNTKQAIALAKLDPKGTLAGEKPRLIDEWQTAPDIWNQVKDDLDADYQFGKFLLTGSSTPVDKAEVYHSGAGRITPVIMRPMTLFESGDADGSVSLSGLFDGKTPEGYDANDDFSIEEAAYLVCRGGWPISVRAQQAGRDVALDVTRNYYNSLFVFEDCDNERFRNKRPEVLKMIVRSYARNISTEASIETILSDVRQSNERTMDRKTFDDYAEALRDIFVLYDMDAWNPAIRSKTSIRSTPTRHFYDTSIACRALGVSPADLVADLESFGLFFEDMAVRDLAAYAESRGGSVSHYRDNAGLECDAVVHMEDGRWAAVEVKLGGEKPVEDGAASLKRLKRKIDEKSDEPSPSFLMVLTASGPRYRREDGVFVTPINKLRD